MSTIKSMLLMVSLFAVNTLSFADGSQQEGGAAAPVQNDPQPYPFADQLRTIVMEELEGSTEVNLSEESAALKGQLDDQNPIYAIASGITARFSEVLQQKGVTHEAFGNDWNPTDGEVVEETEEVNQ